MVEKSENVSLLSELKTEQTIPMANAIELASHSSNKDAGFRKFKQRFRFSKYLSSEEIYKTLTMFVSNSV